jgi:alpha-tubulin suppressor-like RCC1 family protein
MFLPQSHQIRKANIVRYPRFISMAAGDDHLIACTSKGRTFVHPITARANSHGQLGFPKCDSLQDSSASAQLLRGVSETPSTLPHHHQSTVWTPSMRREPLFGSLFEIKALEGVNVVQVAAGGRNSFARTQEGRLVAWGANEFG